MSPRATMMPSTTRRISSMFSTPSMFSILAMMFMEWHSYSFRMWRISKMSSAERVKEAAM